jgi:hypothetical protein
VALASDIQSVSLLAVLECSWEAGLVNLLESLSGNPSVVRLRSLGLSSAPPSVNVSATLLVYPLVT